MPLDIYQDIDPDSGLQQGDIIDKSPEVLSAIGKALPEDVISRASGFITLTQSCDLVRRNKKGCKAKYINLAVFAPLLDNIILLLDDICDKAYLKPDNPISGMYLQRDWIKAKQLLERIINQTEEDRALFFLPPKVPAGIGVHSIAYLQISAPLKIDSYDILRGSLKGRLAIEYQNRLGWLVGNIYSRVAIRDVEKSEKDAIIKSHLNPGDKVDGPFWLFSDVIAEAQGKSIESNGKTNREIYDLLDKIKPSTPKEKAVERALAIFKEETGITNEDTFRRAMHRLNQDDLFGNYIRNRN